MSDRTRKASSKASAERVAAAFLKQGSAPLHKEWDSAYRQGMASLQKIYGDLLKKTGRVFKSGDWELDPRQSFVSHRNHGSDGARMDGQLVFEDLRNEARGKSETEDWLGKHIGFSYGLQNLGYGKWSLSLEE
tara:strand:+ start:529 stop:927 length:399 start_codon:yes stop_codon:yes gene_type:complete